MLENKLFENTLKQFDIGYWELGSLLPNDHWSSEFYNNLKINRKEVEPSYELFTTNILHPEDLELFSKNYNNYKISGLNFRQKIRLRNSTDTYVDFICYTAEEAPINIKSDTKLIFFQKINEYSEDSNPFHYQETANMSSTNRTYIMPKTVYNKQPIFF